MTDANVSGLARELRARGVDCETVHRMMLGSEDSRIPISDPQIVKFLSQMNGAVTLITLDSELASYCANFGIPCIRLQDLVLEHISSLKNNAT